MPTSLSKNPNTKGSYLRRMQDIGRTLRDLELDGSPPHIQFIMLYLACEKAAAIMQAMHKGEKATRLNKPYKLFSDEIIKACKHFSFVIDDAKVHSIFDARALGSARQLRNGFVHDMGPTRLRKIKDSCTDLIPKMQKFLGCVGAVEKWIEVNGTP